MWTLPETPDVIAAGGTLLAGGAAVVGVIVAGCGLNTWKRERNSDCAKRLAGAAYQHRLALIAVIHPWITQEEKDRFELSECTEITAKVLTYRWQKSRRARVDVETVLAEADLRWDEKASHAFTTVKNLEVELLRRIGELSRVERSLQEIEIRRNPDGDFSKIDLEQREDLFAKQQKWISEFEDGLTDDQGVRGEINNAFEPLKALLRKNL